MHFILTIALITQLSLIPKPNIDLPKLFNRALTISCQANFNKALEIWNEILIQEPDNGIALSNRANVLLVLGYTEKAIIEQTNAMKLDPMALGILLNRGISEEVLHQWNQAATDYKWILESNPTYDLALYNLGNVQGSLHNWVAAHHSYQAAALARSDFTMASSNEALMLYQLGNIADAELKLRELIRRYPLFADARAGLTALLWHLNLIGEAKSHWAAVVGLDPRYQQIDWLRNSRHWPPQPILDLTEFLVFIDK
uniref:TPR repeat protein n=1 Tax=Paulinella chromatophora TaxID=39717 RepID=B1X4N4_PAUCH|nr:TPR repeat protein [Paulinella chromatophora]ACB42903.1 TPR repeat protein [Paulinella chromatophora]